MKAPQLRFSLFAMLVLIGIFAIGLGIWQRHVAWETAQEEFTQIIADSQAGVPSAEQVEAVERYLRHYPELSLRDGAMLFAARYGSLETCQLVLEEGADPNLNGAEARSYPIHWAIRREMPEMVPLLIKHGADPSLRTKHRTSGIEEVTPLHIAAIEGDLAMCQLLMEEGASLEDRYAGENTVLHAAVMGGTPEVVQWMLDQGATRQENEVGYDPLKLAEYLRGFREEMSEEARQYDTIVRLLQQQPAPANSTGNAS